MDEKKVAFISCVNNDDWYSECELYLDSLNIPAGISVEALPIYNAPSMESKRGGEKYNVPVGWTAFGIEVLKRYGDTDWISSDGRTEEWAVAYHGFGVRMDGGQIKNIIKTIIHDNLKPGSGQAFAQSRDCRHPGNLCNIGVYTTPNLAVATQYAGTIPLGGKNYKLIIMSRVNPNYIREPETQKGFWILDGKPNQLRPYRLLIRESNTLVYKRY